MEGGSAAAPRVSVALTEARVPVTPLRCSPGLTCRAAAAAAEAELYSLTYCCQEAFLFTVYCWMNDNSTQKCLRLLSFFTLID